MPTFEEIDDLGAIVFDVVSIADVHEGEILQDQTTESRSKEFIRLSQTHTEM